MSRREKARLDEDKTAKPKTEIVGVYDNPDRNPQRRDRNIYLGHAQEYVVRDTAEAIQEVDGRERPAQKREEGNMRASGEKPCSAEGRKACVAEDRPDDTDSHENHVDAASGGPAVVGSGGPRGSFGLEPEGACDRPNEGPSDDDRVSVWMTNYDGCHDRKALKDLIADVRRQERDRDRESPQPKGAINEIVAWLEGLEHTRAQAERIASDPEEKAAMRARRGIYEGIAQDIKHKWGSPSSSDPKVKP